jgi:hypothetical protein
MSRRIFLVPVLIALIWSGALIASKAIADRECFEDSCREAEVVETAPAETRPESKPEPKPEPTTAAAKSEEPQVVAQPQPARTQVEPLPPAVTHASAIPEVVPPEIPMTVVTEAVATETVAPERAAPAAPAAVAHPAGKLMPASVLPKVTAEPPMPKVAAEPAPRAMPPQASTRAEDARMRLEPARVAPGYADTRKPAPVAPSYPETRKPSLAPASAPVASPVASPAPVAVPAPVAARPAQPVRTVNVAVPTYVRPERPPQPAYVPPAVQTLPSDYVVRQQRPPATTAAIVEVPGEIATGDGVLTVHPNLRHDPAWKLCQIDSRDLGRRNYRCTAHSYQPYGEGGYRPYGTYRNYQATPGYVVAPNAKIISIDPND